MLAALQIKALGDRKYLMSRVARLTNYATLIDAVRATVKQTCLQKNRPANAGTRVVGAGHVWKLQLCRRAIVQSSILKDNS